MKCTQVIIIGGGLAGLTAAIDLSNKGIEVILFEKEKYPHHKVCGEYLSAEILPYLKSIGVDLEDLNPAKIDTLEYSSNSGNLTTCPLEMGGLGISRYSLDYYLYTTALNSGCQIIKATVMDAVFSENSFTISTSTGEKLNADFVLGAYGKRSNLDKKLDRTFFMNQSSWLAVKAHYKNDQYPDNLVSLHNFEGGYCGLSKTELDTINVCYLATYNSFKKYKNTEEYRTAVLMQNPRLKEFFQNSDLIFEKELSIAQVNFDKKSVVKEHILMLGDAAGLIHPLCGNGMAMAIHSAKLATDQVLSYYQKFPVSREMIENNFEKNWRINFEQRIKTGRILQRILLNNSFATMSQRLVNTFPGIMPYIIKNTHGQPVYV
ncbi:NAD(P)/FAD-dependent oxidoreductase [Christiangramia sabulilitoris]|uniref:NAD(P)/FAD-dependent oxidoreductase n=1 Tax=Christiangramia sabulilitoris TaxID=2583991 RepID=A0A550I679_9FLAO|nr:NAD(P)/FAD-dependent oxidoreductase [Christiangramia sabulilitoris]TRO66467.1 NAD(P)/FAD-dependent oxidoreductase [Christiangramia sabulilitoris]